MNKVNIEIYQGLIIPGKVDPVEALRYLKELVADLNGMKINFPLDPGSATIVSIKHLKSLDFEKKERWIEIKQNLRTETYLQFSTTIQFEDKDREAFMLEDMSPNEFYVNYILADNFEKRYYDFLMAVDIARTGAAHHGIGLMYIDGIFQRQLNKLHFQSIDLITYRIEKKWPHFDQLNIQKTWNWYITKAFPKGLDIIPDNRLGRAINALSYLYNSDNDILGCLFWAMVGMESLYLEGKSNIAEQICKKVPIILGGENKDRLNEIYDYQSSLVSGTKHFPNYFLLDNRLDDYGEFIEESADILDTVRAILIATLQKMVTLNISELKFDDHTRS